MSALDERRGARRHRLGRGAVRADIEGRGFGAVRDISDRGGVFIEGWEPPEAMRRIRLDAELKSGLRLVLPGAIARRTREGVGIRLELTDLDYVFLARLIAEAKAPDREGPLTLRLREERPEDKVEVELARRWYEVMLEPEGEAQNQRYIEACLLHRRLDEAAERYREARQRHPSFEARQRRVGQLIEFMTLPEKLPAELLPRPRRKRRSLFLWTFLLLVGVISLIGLLFVGVRGQLPAG